MKTYRITVPLIFFVYTLTAHFFHSGDPAGNYFSGSEFYRGYSYAVTLSFASLCLLNLITATGSLKRSIRGTALAIPISVFIHFTGLSGVITAAAVTFSLVLAHRYVVSFSTTDLLYSITDLSEQDRYNPYCEVKRYIMPNPLVRGVKTLLMTLFRLFPNPVPLGIYAFGTPTKESPVLITTNYKLTLFRVAKALEDIDCYLLVVDGKGVNVWCSSGAGHLNIKSVLDAIRLSKIENLVDHRTLILPQLSGVGICAGELKEQSGWSPRFGPLYIKDMERYLRNNMIKERSMHDAEFGIIQRMEMGVGSTLICAFILTTVMIFIDPEALLILIPALYLQSLVFSIISPYIPIRSGVIVGILYAVDTTIFLTLINLAVGVENLSTRLTYLIPLMLSAFYLANEFTGWSPLVKYNLKMILTGKWEPDIRVDREKCSGCGLCISVCPVRVFQMEKGKSRVINRESCEACSACFRQCPEGAITHSAEDTNSCACLYCNVQEHMRGDC